MRDRLVTSPIEPGRDSCFFQRHCALAEGVRIQIRRLDESSARLVWNELIRRNQYLYPNQLPGHHWSRHFDSVGTDWGAVWNRWIKADLPAGVDPITEYLRGVLPWADDLPVLFIPHRDHAFLATWGAFVTAWPHFLYYDEGPLLVSWERPDFVAWGCGGVVGIGIRGASDTSNIAMQRTRCAGR